MTALYKRLTWKVTVTSVGSTLKVMGMIFLIICGAVAFSSLLSFSAVTSGVGNLLTSKNRSLP
jgi:TRAP-type C4-dicarboxylate transport system permease large subunit